MQLWLVVTICVDVTEVMSLEIHTKKVVLVSTHKTVRNLIEQMWAPGMSTEFHH